MAQFNHRAFKIEVHAGARGIYEASGALVAKHGPWEGAPQLVRDKAMRASAAALEAAGIASWRPIFTATLGDRIEAMFPYRQKGEPGAHVHVEIIVWTGHAHQWVPAPTFWRPIVVPRVFFGAEAPASRELEPAG